MKAREQIDTLRVSLNDITADELSASTAKILDRMMAKDHAYAVNLIIKQSQQNNLRIDIFDNMDDFC